MRRPWLPALGVFLLLASLAFWLRGSSGARPLPGGGTVHVRGWARLLPPGRPETADLVLGTLEVTGWAGRLVVHTPWGRVLTEGPARIVTAGTGEDGVTGRIQALGGRLWWSPPGGERTRLLLPGEEIRFGEGGAEFPPPLALPPEPGRQTVRLRSPRGRPLPVPLRLLGLRPGESRWRELFRVAPDAEGVARPAVPAGLLGLWAFAVAGPWALYPPRPWAPGATWVAGFGVPLSGEARTARGQPLPGVTVTAYAWAPAFLPVPLAETRSDTRGRFRFESLPAGTLVLLGRSPGRPPCVAGPLVVRGERARWRLVWSKARVFRGRVLDLTDGRPLAGASVALRVGALTLLAAATDRAGRFCFRAVFMPSPSLPRLEVHAVAPGRRPVALPASAGRELLVRLPRAATLRGHVTGGRPPVRVRAVRVADLRCTGAAVTGDEEGRFVLSGLVPGEPVYVVARDAAGRLGVAAPRRPREGSLALPLRAGHELTGRLEGGGGLVLRLVPLTPGPAGAAFPRAVIRLVRTDPEGRFHFPHLPPGRYVLGALDRRGSWVSPPFRVPGPEHSWKFEPRASPPPRPRPRPPGFLRGRVVTPDGAPVPAGEILLAARAGEGTDVRLAWADPEGAFLVPWVRTGHYALLVRTEAGDRFVPSLAIPPAGLDLGLLRLDPCGALTVERSRPGGLLLRRRLRADPPWILPPLRHAPAGDTAVRWENLPPGPYDVWWLGAGGRLRRRSVTVGPGETRRLRVP